MFLLVFFVSHYVTGHGRDPGSKMSFFNYISIAQLMAIGKSEYCKTHSPHAYSDLPQRALPHAQKQPPRQGRLFKLSTRCRQLEQQK